MLSAMATGVWPCLLSPQPALLCPGSCQPQGRKGEARPGEHLGRQGAGDVLESLN